MASQYTNVFCNIMPLWIKYKYTGLSVQKSSNLHFTCISYGYFCPNGYLLEKKNDLNIFSVKNKYGFEFTKTPFHARESIQLYTKCLVL